MNKNKVLNFLGFLLFVFGSAGLYQYGFTRMTSIFIELGLASSISIGSYLLWRKQ